MSLTIRKLSLSKKGFDTEYGGRPSPILFDGRMVTLPIPEPRNGVSKTSYAALRHDGRSLSELMRDLGYEKPDRNRSAHLDPDLIFESRHRASSWRGTFGQVDGSETRLRRQRVGSGSLFLFWGWFELEEELRAKKRPSGFSAIFAYLEVDYVVEVGTDPIIPFARYHPHFAEQYPRRSNRVYVARKQLSWDNGKPGWGVFKYHSRLRLSVPNQNRSTWQLPGCFHPDRGCTLDGVGYWKSVKGEKVARWGTEGRNATVEVPRRGQEYICDLRGNVNRWARRIIDRTEIWSPPITSTK